MLKLKKSSLEYKLRRKCIKKLILDNKRIKRQLKPLPLTVDVTEERNCITYNDALIKKFHMIDGLPTGELLTEIILIDPLDFGIEKDKIYKKLFKIL